MECSSFKVCVPQLSIKTVGALLNRGGYKSYYYGQLRGGIYQRTVACQYP